MQTQSSKFIFNCAFCHYESTLDLKECPECGRLSRDKKPAAGKARAFPAFRFQDQAPVDFNAAPTFAENRVYECGHCRYQTTNKLAECPECGRRKFAPAAARVEPERQKRFLVRKPSNKFHLDCFFIGFGIAFLYESLLVLKGGGIATPGSALTEYIAGFATNSQFALWLFIGSVLSILFGLFLRAFK